MVVYNDSFMANVTNPVDLMVGVGNVTGQPFLLGYMILLSFFLIFLILAIRFSFSEVLIIDGFISTIIAILLYVAGLLPVTAIAYPVVLMVLAIILLVFMR